MLNDEKVVIETMLKWNLEIGVKPVYTTSMIISLALKPIKELLARNANTCNALKIKLKQICITKAKFDATQAFIISLNREKVKCRATSNNETCVEKIENKISKLEEDLGRYKSKLEDLTKE